VILYYKLVMSFTASRPIAHLLLFLQAQLHSKHADGAAGGAAHMQQLRRRSLLLQLRCGLARVLRDAVAPATAAAGSGALTAAAGLSAASGLSGDLLTCVGHQAQVGAVWFDYCCYKLFGSAQLCSHCFFACKSYCRGCRVTKAYPNPCQLLHADTFFTILSIVVAVAAAVLVLVQPTVDAMGRPTLLLVRDTADQAIEDLKALAVDLEDLLAFLQTPDSLTTNADVAHKLADWGPGLAGLNPSKTADLSSNLQNPGMQNGSSALAKGAGAAADAATGASMALVLAGGEGTAARDAQLALRAGAAAAAAGASGFGGLDPAAARRLARQCAAKGAAGLLGLLTQQLNLLEQCLAIVLLHFVQVGVLLQQQCCGKYCRCIRQGIARC
jgi:hypothetical protein